ncbi:hypothetical protein [Flindersiella endophytica]
MEPDQVVRCESRYFPTGVAGVGLMWLVGLVAAVVYRLRDPGSFERYGPAAFPLTLLVFGGLLVLTISLGVILDRYVVRAIEFGRTHVRLESRARVRTVPVAELTGVRVSHGGDTERGYQQTSLTLRWLGGGRTIDCDHDPALGQALTRLLPSRVAITEQWNELDEPDPS